MKPIRLMAGFFTVGVWTMASRILGFVRDILIVGYLGSGPVAQAFFVAFGLPNMFRRFFAEGAFNMAFVPMFSKKLEGDEDPQGFARDAFSGLATILLVFSLIAILAMPWLVVAMASGFLGDERFDLAVIFGRIAFPYILFISLAALLSGLLNATGRFAAAAAAPVLLNVLFVLSVMLGARLGWPLGLTLAWTVPVAGLAQLALVWVAAARVGFALWPKRPRVTPDLKRLAMIAAPAALAGGVLQINLMVGRQVASFFDGAIVWLYTADRLYQLPLGVVGIAIGIVLLPDLSRRLRAGDTAGGQDAFNRAAEIGLALTVPAAVALCVIPVPLIHVLFQRGAFDGNDTLATASAVAVYGLGLPAFVLQKVLQPLYFAREDTTSPFRFALVAMVVNAVYGLGLPAFVLQKVLQPLYFAREDTTSPFRFALVAMVVNAVLAVGLIYAAGFLAAAIGTTVASWVMVLLLWIGSRTMGEAAAIDDRLKLRTGRIMLAATFMGLSLYTASLWLAPWLYSAAWRYPALIVLIVFGIFVYFFAAHHLGALRLPEIRRTLRRQR